MDEIERNRLLRQFEKRLRDDAEEAVIIGYYPARFLQMLDNYPADEVARKLIASGDLQEGLKRLKREDRLDLALETVMQEKEFRRLFSEEEIKAAEWRLQQL